ncbi:MAG: 1-acyl-sn-glycerol-3-phosphate acyltransferase [Methylobacteriaceae bacterium]|nr:1-acyl-sn-glycerol-3-phosphate acyltransferase [Methylobacteriaceae bacterium]
MLLLRSLIFNAVFYLNLALRLIPAIGTFLLPRRAIIRTAQAWGRSSVSLMERIVGTKAEFRGLENIPSGGLLVAAKHHSFWETFALLPIFDDPTFVMKRELSWIPVFGWLTTKAGMIPIDRGGGAAAIARMNRHALQAVRDGRQILIFPEGTRRSAGAEPAYRNGIAHLYRQLGVPCLPVALNSGAFWPRRSFLRRPGTIVVEILPPIQPGLEREAFMRELQDRIETATNRLLDEARAANGR